MAITVNGAILANGDPLLVDGVQAQSVIVNDVEVWVNSLPGFQNDPYPSTYYEVSQATPLASPVNPCPEPLSAPLQLYIGPPVPTLYAVNHYTTCKTTGVLELDENGLLQGSSSSYYDLFDIEYHWQTIRATDGLLEFSDHSGIYFPGDPELSPGDTPRSTLIYDSVTGRFSGECLDGVDTRSKFTADENGWLGYIKYFESDAWHLGHSVKGSI